MFEVLCFHVVAPLQLHVRGEMLYVHVLSFDECVVAYAVVADMRVS